ncbi:MAG: ABC transporter permease [Burkholderiales bacterium]|nr:ABC transporter permease [Burkholderiales bacterium]
MISVEILLIFIVVFGVVVGFVYNLSLYKESRGFDYSDRWRVQLSSNSDALNQANPQLLDHFYRGLQAMPEVEGVSFIQSAPYSDSGYMGGFRAMDSTRMINTYFLQADDAAQKILNIPMIAGRWFSEQDEVASETPVIINRKMAQSMFGQEDPLGKRLTNASLDEKEVRVYKVVGVIENYRHRGEFMSREELVILRYSAYKEEPLRQMVIKVKAGTPRNFEIKLLQQLRSVHSDLEYDIALLSEGRDEMFRQKGLFFAPPLAIAAFLMLMVGFGLFGVLGLNVSKRIPEIGLRRAIGATRLEIYGQIIAEQVLLSSLAMVVGLLFLIQLPLTGVMAKFMDWQSFFVSVGISMLIVYVVSLLCSLYPAWRASQLDPSEALRYE